MLGYLFPQVGMMVLSGRRGGFVHGGVPGTTTSPGPYRGFRHPAVAIVHAVWLYHRSSLSLRDVETILAVCHCGARTIRTRWFR